MGLSIGNLNKRNWNSITGNFVKKEEHIEKAIEFTKTGKQIKESLQRVLTAVGSEITSLKTRIDALKAEIGSEPDSMVSDWWLRDTGGTFPYNRYTLDYSKLRDAAPSIQFGMNVLNTSQPADETAIEKKKDKFNDLLYELREKLSRQFRLNRIMNNLDDKSKQKLSEGELTEYGF